MIDICYVGNSSIDNIKNNGRSKKTLGGSAIYSSIASRFVSDKKISIISNVNKDVKQMLDNYNIEYIGNLVPEITEFNIDEEKSSCNFVKEINNNICLDTLLEIDNLHISFRKGVNIDYILSNPNIRYKKLSIDVMIHSVKNFIPSLIKYNSKINTLFCNLKEYEIIRKYVNNIPRIIITNEDNPVILIEKDKNYLFEVNSVNNIVSSTGAGDSFIGGYLGAYTDGKKISECINIGIQTAKNSLQNFGPLRNLNKTFTVSEVKRLPKNILVIGNSCAGKTTFIECFKKYFNIYSDIDDLNPLLEMFFIDDISRENDINKLKKINGKIKYMTEIYEEYIHEFPNISHYSSKAIKGNGHDIINPVLWDIILKKSVIVDKEKNNIIQFSRGKDKLYEEAFGTDIYKRSISEVIGALNNSNDILIINLISDLNIRKMRNNIRYKNGGHFVSEDTMDNVYNEDIFRYKHIDDNRGYIHINNINYPVYTIINNKMLSSFELNSFLIYNIKEVIEYFNNWR